MYPLIGHIDNGMVAGAIREIFVLSSQFCCKPKIALKTKQQQQQQKKTPLQEKQKMENSNHYRNWNDWFEHISATSVCLSFTSLNPQLIINSG